MTTNGTAAAPYSPLVSIDGLEYFPEPYSSPNLRIAQRYGMIPVASLATISVVSTVCLLIFIFCRMVDWKGYYGTCTSFNQYVALVVNLLLADLQQSSAFLINWHWLRIDRILAPSRPCFAQGWLLHSGDVSGGFFVLAIAIHTYYTAVHGRRVGDKTFVAIVVGIWIWSFLLTAISIWLHGSRQYFTAAGSWCWVSPAFEIDRLWTHYVWIFIIQFGTILIYLAIFCTLRTKAKRLLVSGQAPSKSPAAATIKAVNRTTMLMMMYPIVYIVLTLPLSTGRMWTMSHGGKETGDVYTCIAGSFLTSCGWVDSLLYTLTRKRLLKGDVRGTSTTRSVHGERIGKNVTQTRTAIVPGGTSGCDEVSPEARRRSCVLPPELFEDTPPTTSDTGGGGNPDPMLACLGAHRGGGKAVDKVAARRDKTASPQEVMLPPPPAYTDTRAHRRFWEDRCDSPTHGV